MTVTICTGYRKLMAIENGDPSSTLHQEMDLVAACPARATAGLAPAGCGVVGKSRDSLPYLTSRRFTKRIPMIRALAIALALVSTQQADPHPLEGVWNISFPWHIEVVNGVVTPTMESGELRVEVKGDSLIAVVARTPSADVPEPRPIRLAAPLGTGQVVFETRDKVTMASAGGAERTMTVISIWVLRPSGDQLGGTLERKLEGAQAASHGPLPLTGSRVRR